MDEKRWLTCTDPMELFGSLSTVFYRTNAPISERKERLITCGQCRRHWHLLTDARSRRAVIAAERFSDGQLSRRTLQRALTPARQAEVALALPFPPLPGRSLSTRIEGYDRRLAALFARQVASARPLTEPPSYAYVWAWGRRASSERRARCDLYRDVLGNPFRVVPLDPSWRKWNDDTVGRLAQSIYDQRRFGEMPVLADALEEAGCEDPDILTHCRSGGVHVPGCWVIDLLLGKE